MLPTTAHIEQPWRIHEIAPDFRLYDVWALPTPGGPEDFPKLVQQFLDGDTADNPSRLARGLFALRWRLGAWLGWDDPDMAVGTRVPSLRDRLPADLAACAVPDPARLPFRSLYATGNEWAAEMANRTVHGVLHLSWVPYPGSPGRHRGQMAVLVKPNGIWGRAYMAAIAPFRHLIVYPSLLRGIGATWLERRAPEVQSRHHWDRSGPGRGPMTYSDTLTLRAQSGRPAEWWARTIFERLIHPVSREAVLSGALLLRPHRGHGSLAGWHVEANSPERVRLRRSGPLMVCHLEVSSDQGSVRIGSRVEPHHRVGAAVWRRIAPIHRSQGEALLRGAWRRSLDEREHPIDGSEG